MRTGFELASIFGKFSGLISPREIKNVENRLVADVIEKPFHALYDPNSLHFPDHMLPTVPGNSNVTCGVGMVEYAHQPHWDRNDPNVAGPVRRFFWDLMYDNRVKHL